MRIFILSSVPVSPPWDQGDKNLAYTLTRVMQQHEFQVLTNRRGERPLGANLSLLPLYRRAHPTLLEKMGVVWWLLRHGQRPPDLFHFVYRPYPLSTWMLRRLPAFSQRPVLHTMPAAGNDGQLSSHLFFADHLVALSLHGQDHLRRQGLNNVTYIPAGIDLVYWQNAAGQRDYWKNRLGIDGRPAVLYPGHYGPGYGVDVIMKALPQLLAAVPDLCLIFACRRRSRQDKAREQAIQQQLAANGLEHTVLFYNTVNDMRALIGASDVTILPLETMRDKVDIPTTLLESLAAGVPIIISDLAPMSELLTTTSEPPGLSIKPGDAGQLAEALIHLLQDEAARSELGRSGQKLTASRYDIQAVASQYDHLYQELTRL